MTVRRNSSTRPTRSPSNRSLRPALLVFTEGEKTEPQYLTPWLRQHRASVTVEIDRRHGTPMTLVSMAIDAQSAAAKDERRGRGTAPSGIWCVFDRDEHPLVEEAKALAATNGILVAFSNPCFELWLLLHYQDQIGWLERDRAQSLFKTAASLRKYKQLPPEITDHLMQHNDEAADRARRLDQLHSGNGSPEGENPSSSVWRLIDAIRNN